MNLGHEPWTNGLATMHRNHHATAVRVPKKVVIALHADDFTSCYSKRSDYLPASRSGKPAYTSTNTL
jgi:hypothetical protein